MVHKLTKSNFCSIIWFMETITKLQLLAEQMHLEPAEEVDPFRSSISLPVVESTAPCGLPLKQNSLGIFQAQLPGGSKPILKTLLTSACERNCYYCPFRAGRNYRRTTFKPEEMAQTTMELYRAGLIEGLFLSSGIIKGGVTTQDKIIATAEMLRQKHHFRGYLHLKIMPGAEKAQVERLMQLADRVSVNLEAPNTERLQLLAPGKRFLDELLQPLSWAQEIRQTAPAGQSWNGRWASSVTQFVVGAVGENDLELLQTTAYLYHRLGLRRAYFSAFHPVSNTPLAEQPAENPLREHRLYQSSFLLRDYGFDMEELPFDPAGRLPLETDPKLSWAQHNLADKPIEINRAGREELLRIPGIGPKGVQTILAARRKGKIRNIKELQQLGIITSRLGPYVLLDGIRPGHQLRLKF